MPIADSGLTENRYLSGNFAPVTETHPLTACSHVGSIPPSLGNGQYVRNGVNPLLNDDLGREAHWFDGDGMLTGVLFRKLSNGQIQPEFVNQYIETDIWKASNAYLKGENKSIWKLRRPIPPSIATLISPASRVIDVIYEVFRTMFIVILSQMPWSKNKIKHISVANTAVYYHDGRVLATCESGPPMQVELPELSTVGWFLGIEEGQDVTTGFGGSGPLSVLRAYTTGHPKVDEESGEMMLFHNTFVPPYVQYSVLSSKSQTNKKLRNGMLPEPDRLNVTIPGITSPKLMHDFGCSATHTVIMDLPLSLNPLSLLRGEPIVSFDLSQPARFGVFPRHHPEMVQWFEDDGCVIFHTACTWDEYDESGDVVAVCMLVCRMINADAVFTAGNIDITSPQFNKTQSKKRRSAKNNTKPGLESNHSDETLIGTIIPEAVIDKCQLHFYRFPLFTTAKATDRFQPSHSFPLSRLSLEFPTTAPGKSISAAQYVYTCSSSEGEFCGTLGKASNINIIAKLNVAELVRIGRTRNIPKSKISVDTRVISEVLDDNHGLDSGAISLFKLPTGVYGGEPRFVPSSPDSTVEDDGHLLFFAFDEAQLQPNGEAPKWAFSELWILDARGMKDVVAKVQLKSRISYGLHGDFFDERQILEQKRRRTVR